MWKSRNLLSSWFGQILFGCPWPLQLVKQRKKSASYVQNWKKQGKILKVDVLPETVSLKFLVLVLKLITTIIHSYQNSSKDSLRLEHWAGCVGVRKQDIPPLSKLHVVFASFLSHLRGGSIQCLHIFPLKLLGCFQSWVTATPALKRAGVGVCWTKVQCLWVFSQSDTGVPMETDFWWCPLCGVVLGWLK